jgi:hypothetical protein
MLAFKKVANHIPGNISIIIESQVNENDINLEVQDVFRILDKKELVFAA